MTLSRRNALKLGLGAGAVPLLAGFPMPASEPALLRRTPGPAVTRARALPLSAVRLTGGPLKHAQELDRQYLLALEPDRMLAYYRQRAGLAPKAEPYGGGGRGGRHPPPAHPRPPPSAGRPGWGGPGRPPGQTRRGPQ